MNVPIFVTVLRIALIPVGVAVYALLPENWTSLAAAQVFGLAAFTD